MTKISAAIFIVLLFNGLSCGSHKRVENATVVGSGAEFLENVKGKKTKQLVKYGVRVFVFNEDRKQEWHGLYSRVLLDGKEGYMARKNIMQDGGSLAKVVGRWVKFQDEVPEMVIDIRMDGTFIFPGEFFVKMNAIGKGEGNWDFDESKNILSLKFTDSSLFKEAMRQLDIRYKTKKDFSNSICYMSISDASIKINISELMKSPYKNIVFSGYHFTKRDQ